MAIFETWLNSDLKKPLRVAQLSGNLFSEDANGNLIGVEVFDNGSPASFSNISSVHGYIIRADGYTVATNGTLSGNKASIVLPASAYAVIGQVSIVIKVDDMTVGACVCYVYKTTTDVIVDPGSVVPSISELLDKIGACEAATLAASSAASVAISAASSVNSVIQAANSAIASAVEATSCAISAAVMITDMTVEASPLPPMTPPTATISDVDGHKHIAFGIPEGLAGCIEETDNTEAEVMTFSDGADNLPMEVSVAINPVQDTHGFDPYPAGGGKNLLRSIGTPNTSASVSCTQNDENGCVITNAVADTRTSFSSALQFYNSSGTIIQSTSASNGSIFTFPAGSTSCRFGHSGSTKDIKVTLSIDNLTEGNTYKIFYNLASNHPDTIGGLIINKVMFCESTETDDSYMPYSNICPISGWDAVGITRTGKNLFDVNSYPFTNSKYVQATTGYVYATANDYACTNDFVPFVGFDGKTITLNKRPGGGNTGIAFYSDAVETSYISGLQNANETAGTPMKFTVPNGTKYIRFTVPKDATEIQLEYGSSATAYEPFGTTYHISLPTTAYGGTLTVNKDGSGRLVVDTASWTLNGSEANWEYTTASSGRRFRIAVSNISGMGENGDADTVKSDKFVWSDSANATWGHIRLASGSLNFTDNNSVIPDQATFQTWLSNNNVQVVAPLSTPITMDFTANQIRSLFGTVNVFSESGNVLNVVYYADTKMYIDNLFSTIVNGTGVSF